MPFNVAAQSQAVGLETGKAVYDFYCYQCHGYSGDAQTLASTYLQPPPRNFTASDPRRLSRERMLDAVYHGRSGTGMVSFTRVLNDSQITAVVEYVRDTFMTQQPLKQPYHSRANGWPDHERYRAAFPFATGRILLDTPWEELNAEQIKGKRLFMTACISCHDRARVRDEGPIWEPRAVSYPRRHYSHRQPQVDGLTGATPYALHGQPPPVADDSDTAIRNGEAIFQKNCAFCHAADGTGHNWIGSFLEPRPRDLGGARVVGMTAERLGGIIREGVPDTSMPAWKYVLDDKQIADVVAYVQGTLQRRPASLASPPSETSANPRQVPLTWIRESR